MLKFWLGSKMMPAVALSDFSGERVGLPAKTPEMLAAAFVTGSMTAVKNVATEGEISGSDGARKPLPQFARSRIELVGLNLMPTFGLVVLPKSLYLSWR